LNPPKLHIQHGLGKLCGYIGDETNWPQRYLDDEVARFLEFCEKCEQKYVEKYSQEKMDAKRDWMRRDLSEDSIGCPCGRHPDGEYILSPEESQKYTKPKKKVVKTIRMYLEVGA
jgi:hypothetical protein